MSVFADETLSLKEEDCAFLKVSMVMPLQLPGAMPSDLYYDGRVNKSLTHEVSGVEGVLDCNTQEPRVMVLKKKTDTLTEKTIQKGVCVGYVYTIVDIDEPILDDTRHDVEDDLWTLERIKTQLEVNDK